jgi:1,4-dihydroxy-2-naphthoyl-CoA synthase
MYPREVSETPEPGPEQHHAPELELELMRAAVRKMAARRPTCSRCARSLLVGELAHVFSAAGDERHICALCLVTEVDGSSAGNLLRTERVRAGERPLNVRRAA